MEKLGKKRSFGEMSEFFLVGIGGMKEVVAMLEGKGAYAASR